jgi:hypothetical protein
MARILAPLGLAIVLCLAHSLAAAVNADPQAGESSAGPGKKEIKAGKSKKTELEKDRALEDEFFERQDIVPSFKFEFIPEEEIDSPQPTNVNPATEAVLGVAADATVDDARRAIAAAR